MRGELGILTIIVVLAYTYYDPFFDVCQNFGVYFPFVRITTYLDLVKRIALPRLQVNNDERFFSLDELKKCNGEHDSRLYLSILGHVFDVSAGIAYYGAGKKYHAFTGRDASRAFITGDFTEADLTDHVLDLPLQDLLHLKEWLQMYEQRYIRKGKLIGLFYNENGSPTEYNQRLDYRMQQAEEEKILLNMEKHNYPPCNVEWNVEKGSRVWCTRKSGGIERNWSGVPRKLYLPGSKSHRCACINISQYETQKHAQQNDGTFSRYLLEYENCEPNSSSCYVKT